MIKTYIKNNGVPFFEIEELDTEAYNIGVTLEDYRNGKLVVLTDEQAAYHTEHPDADPEEVLNLGPSAIGGNNTERSFEDVLEEKINTIKAYDTSDNVNVFSINGTNLWLDKSMRSGLLVQIEALESEHEDTISICGDTEIFEMGTREAKDIIFAVELYASQVYLVTKRHLIAVNSLTTIEEVESYNHTTGYPMPLNFNVE